jgi:hypothetical protein
MATGSERVPPILAASKNAEAVGLIASGKLRDALRVLNEAIYSSPDYPHSYANRAVVFDRLGMAPQAEADRRRAVDLAQSGGYAEPEVFAQPSLRARPRNVPREPPRVPRSTVSHDSHPRTRRFLAMSETAVVLVALGGLAATAGGLYVAADKLRGADINLNVFDFESFQESLPEATVSVEPTASPEPTPPPVTPPPEALNGAPYSFSTLQDSWKSKGMEASIGSVNNAFTGFRATPFDVTLSRGGTSAVFFVFIYPDRNGPSQDWNLGGVPSPQSGRRAPAFERGWFNSNVIVLLRSGSGEIANEAKTAFLALGG